MECQTHTSSWYRTRLCQELGLDEILWNELLAERVGFEPTVQFPAHTLSKRAP
jgi:hypothetical protein